MKSKSKLNRQARDRTELSAAKSASSNPGLVSAHSVRCPRVQVAVSDGDSVPEFVSEENGTGSWRDNLLAERVARIATRSAAGRGRGSTKERGRGKDAPHLTLIDESLDRPESVIAGLIGLKRWYCLSCPRFAFLFVAAVVMTLPHATLPFF